MLEKGLSNFRRFPPEMRMMIIDKMEADDRCRFSGSSKLSNKEAKASKNYIYGLELHFSEVPHIKIKHGNCEDFDKSYKGMRLIFVKHLNNNLMICKSLLNWNRQLWDTKLDSSIDIRRLAIDEFNILLQKYQSSIKKLEIVVFVSIHSTSFPKFPIHFEIKNLKNLEELCLKTQNAPWVKIDVGQFLSETRKSLKNLELRGDTDGRLLGECEQIYQVQHEFISFTTQLNHLQLLRLSATMVRINIGNLTEKDIYNFVRFWQNEKTGKDLKSYTWFLEKPNFDVEKMFWLFGKNAVGLEKKRVDFEHNENATRTARLFVNNWYTPPLLVFHELEKIEEDINSD